jgi:2-polyprenyl-3-methyl-5-hydroxy-6-metoxy-1,4-benzoquinol methylase
MLAPRYFDAAFTEWNKKWGAPFGFQHTKRLQNVGVVPLNQRVRLAGCFAFQANNTTREFEYPWVYAQLEHSSRKTIVDVGAGLTGLQFVLSKQGHRVYCVDPGLADAAEYSWGSSPVSHETLNAAFHTDVERFPIRLEDTGFTANSIDYITCVSTIEHVPQQVAESIMRRAEELLVKGGKLVLTIDLSLDIEPWTDVVENRWGSNINVKRLVDAASGMDLTVGIPSELYGFPEFDAKQIQRDLSKYYVGEYPCMSQCLVLTKR